MKKKYKNNSPTIDELENKADDLPVSSSTDCTGLIPSAPQTEDELESYTEIQPSLFPENILSKHWPK